MEVYIMIICIIIIGIPIEIYRNIPRHDLNNAKGIDRFMKDSGQKLKLIRIIPKMYGRSREVPLKATSLLNSRFITNVDLLILYDESKLLRRIIYKIEFTE